MPIWALWLTCFGLLTLRALIAAAESALYGISDLRAKELAEDRPGAGARVLRHKLEREATAAAIRIGMVMSGFLAAAIGALVPPRLVHLVEFGETFAGLAPPLLGALLVGLLAAVFDVLLRGLANAAPETWALRLAWLVSLLVVTLYPLMRVLLGTLNLLGRPFKVRLRFESPPPPLEELEKLLAAQAASAHIDKGAPELIRSIFELSDKRVRDVMVPRTEVVAVELSEPANEILRILAEENHSRIPVFRDEIDHIVGVLHARDLIPLLQHPELIVVPDIIRPAHFVPWMKPMGDLLREMQVRKIHMAMVVDEYGGFMGIVTLEDILREIVGDIGDEFEVEEKQVEKLADGTFLVDAGIDLDSFATAFEVVMPEESDSETLGGFISQLAGSIPEVGERFVHSGLALTVHSKEGARLDRVRVQKLQGATASPPREGAAARAGGAPADGPPPPPGEAAAEPGGSPRPPEPPAR
jgi:CBS domain containing-hemolysin-like protein